MPKGGKRMGAGGRFGKRGPHKATIVKTLEKQAIRDEVRARVSQELDALVSAQIANAKGLKYLVSRDKTGKFNRIGPDGVTGAEGEVIEVWEKDPAIAAFTDLLNRASDKPTEHVEMKVTSDLEKRLTEGRARNAAAKSP